MNAAKKHLTIAALITAFAAATGIPTNLMSVSDTGPERHYVSLMTDGPQTIYPKQWTLVRFPSTASPVEQSDRENMHRYGSGERSALIYPAHTGVIGHWYAKVNLRGGNYTEIRMQYIRDPLNAPDVTGTNHYARSPGWQYFSTSHMFIADADTPVAFRVRHNGSKPVTLSLAQFKLGYHE